MCERLNTGFADHFCLVGGLELDFDFSINIGNFIIPIDFHIFCQRDGSTTNQTSMSQIFCLKTSTVNPETSQARQFQILKIY